MLLNKEDIIDAINFNEMTEAEQIFEKHIGLNTELGYLPYNKEDIIDAINEALTIQRVSQQQTEQFTQDAFNSSIFNNTLIGKKDSNGIELKNGDNIIIEVCKTNGANRYGVYHKGQIVYQNCSFSIKIKRNEKTFDITPLSNYASYCKITLNN